MSEDKKLVPIGRGTCDVTIEWATGWKFTAKGYCTSLTLESLYGLGNTEVYSLHDCKFYPPNIEGEKSHDEASC